MTLREIREGDMLELFNWMGGEVMSVIQCASGEPLFDVQLRNGERYALREHHIAKNRTACYEAGISPVSK